MFTLTFKYCQNIDEITDIQNRNPTDQKIKIPAMQKMSSIRSYTKILLQESTMRWPNVLADTYPQLASDPRMQNLNVYTVVRITLPTTGNV